MSWTHKCCFPQVWQLAALPTRRIQKYPIELDKEFDVSRRRGCNWLSRLCYTVFTLTFSASEQTWHVLFVLELLWFRCDKRRRHVSSRSFRCDSHPAHPGSAGGQRRPGDGPILPPPPSQASQTGPLARPLDPKRRCSRGDHEHAAGCTRGWGGARRLAPSAHIRGHIQRCLYDQSFRCRWVRERK